MVRLYDLWNPRDGLPATAAATALREAMDFVRRDPDHPERKDPKFWAGWQLWGLPD